MSNTVMIQFHWDEEKAPSTKAAAEYLGCKEEDFDSNFGVRLASKNQYMVVIEEEKITHSERCEKFSNPQIATFGPVR